MFSHMNTCDTKDSDPGQKNSNHRDVSCSWRFQQHRRTLFTALFTTAQAEQLHHCSEHLHHIKYHCKHTCFTSSTVLPAGSTLKNQCFYGKSEAKCSSVNQAGEDKRRCPAGVDEKMISAWTSVIIVSTAFDLYEPVKRRRLTAAAEFVSSNNSPERIQMSGGQR